MTIIVLWKPQGSPNVYQVTPGTPFHVSPQYRQTLRDAAAAGQIHLLECYDDPHAEMRASIEALAVGCQQQGPVETSLPNGVLTWER